MRLDSRQQMMDYLGAKQRNIMWSWCAANDEERKVYFSLWQDTRKKRNGEDQPSYVVQGPDWGIDAKTGKPSAARKDHDEKLALVFEQGYQPFGYLVVAKDVNAEPREIEKTKTSFIFELKVRRCSDGRVLAYPVRRIEIG